MKTKIKQASAADKIFMGILGAVIAIYAVSLLIPIVWTVMVSFKDGYDYTLNPYSLPDIWQFSNYAEAFKKLSVKVWSTNESRYIYYDFFSMFGYSLLITAATSFMSVFLPSLTAYAISKYSFRGRNFLYGVAIFTMILPIVGSLPSSISIHKALNTYDNLIPFLLTSGSGFGFNFVLLYGAYKGFSKSYAEAAFLDGANHFIVMFRIYYPMMMPVFFSLFVLGFVNGWNDYMLVITYLPSYPNLAYGAYVYQNNAAVYAATMPEIMAGLVIVALPTVVIWLISQKFIVQKMTVGGLKG